MSIKAELAAEILTSFAESVAAEQKKRAWDKLDVPIEYFGRAITLPDDPSKMPLEKAREALDRKIKDEAQPFHVYEMFDAYPHDAAVAFVKAMTKLYGWASPQTIMTFFGPKPPQMLSIKTGPGIADVMQCPFGAFKLPGVDELVHTNFDTDGKGRPFFYITAEVKKGQRHLLLQLAEETRNILRAESIYRGRPIRLGVNDDGELDLNNPPEFLDVSDTTEASLLFDEEIRLQIEDNILVPIKETAMCRKIRVPLKRGILLEGKYGTGKSLNGRMVANVAQQHGWTFILLDKVQGLRVALEFANRYSPAVVFAEDIDRIAEYRDDGCNDLINVIDGVVSKRAEIMTVLTTNYVEKLDQVILRPGRLDAVISLKAPGAKTVEKLIRHYAGKLISEDEDLTSAGIELDGQIPASIRECVERAKLGMIRRHSSRLICSDVVTSALTMKNHLNLLNKETKRETPAERLYQCFTDLVDGGGSGSTFNPTTMFDAIDSTHSVARATLSKVGEISKEINGGGLTKTMTALSKKIDSVKERADAIYDEVT